MTCHLVRYISSVSKVRNATSGRVEEAARYTETSVSLPELHGVSSKGDPFKTAWPADDVRQSRNLMFLHNVGEERSAQGVGGET
jgi:hypothetical protein